MVHSQFRSVRVLMLRLRAWTDSAFSPVCNGQSLALLTPDAIAATLRLRRDRRLAGQGADGPGPADRRRLRVRGHHQVAQLRHHHVRRRRMDLRHPRAFRPAGEEGRHADGDRPAPAARCAFQLRLTEGLEGSCAAVGEVAAGPHQGAGRQRRGQPAGSGAGADRTTTARWPT